MGISIKSIFDVKQQTDHMPRIKYILYAVTVLIMAVTTVLYVFTDNHFLIRKWNLPLSPPGFYDSRQFAWASESYAQGYDPLIKNPVNPTGQQLNYPRIWHLLFALGINESHTNILGSSVVILFFIGLGIFWFTRKYDALTYMVLSIVILSPPVMLGIERSNIELVLFFILSLALALNNYSVISSLSLFVFASILKLYPLFGFVYLLREKKRKFWILFLSASGIFIIYALFSLTDFMHVFKTTPKIASSSFGINVWWMGLRHPRFFGLPISDSTALYLKIISYAAAVLILAAALIISMRRKDSVLSKGGKYIDAFRTGAGIYMGCFMMMNTIDYRLIFLVFVVPQIVEWLRVREKDISLVCVITLGMMIFSLWSMFIMRFLGRNVTFVMEELCNWIMLACLLYLFISSLPDWLRYYISRPFSRIKLINEQAVSR